MKTNKNDLDFDAGKLLEEAYAEIRFLRSQKPPPFSLRRLTQEVGKSEHLADIFCGDSDLDGAIDES